jgi:hypothetical protein
LYHVTDQYKEWFYANIYTKQTQWDKPTEPVYPPGGDVPPSYDSNSARPGGAEKTGGTGAAIFGAGAGAGAGSSLSADEELARKLQAEENARAHGGAVDASRMGAADGYYNQGGAPQYGQQPAGYQQQPGYAMGAPGYDQQQPGKSKGAGGLLGKLLGKGKSSHPQPGYYPQQQQQQQGYGGYPQQQYMAPGRRPGGGMGMMGGAALGAGGGLLGGVLLADAMHGKHCTF